MPTDFETIYNIEETVLSASSAALLNQGIAAAYTERDIEVISTPFVALTINAGSPIHMYWLDNTGSVYDAWNFSMDATVCTNRMKNNISHSIYRNKVINTLADYRTYDTLPYHIVNDLKVESNNKGLDEANDLDTTNIRLGFQVWVKPDAWPV